MTDPDGGDGSTRPSNPDDDAPSRTPNPDDDAPSRTPNPDDDAPNRRRAALATLPFLALGLVVTGLAVALAPQPLWAFLILPPVAFMSVLTYLTFRSDFLDDR